MGRKNQLKKSAEREKKQIQNKKKIQNFFHLNVTQETKLTKAAKMLQRENKQKKNRFCIKETNLITIAKKKNTKTKGLFYFNKNYQFLKKIVIALVAPPMSYSKKKV